MLLREPHRAVHLMADLGDLARSFANARFGDGYGESEVRRAVCSRREIGSRGGGRILTGSVGEHLLNRLKLADRAPELLALRCISHRIVDTTLHRADHLLRANHCTM